MIRRPPRSTRTDTLFPYTTLFKAQAHTTSLGAQPRIAGYETTRVNREASKQSALSLAGPWTGRSRCQLLMDGHPSLLRCAAYDEIGRASCREGVGQSVSNPWVAVSLKKKKQKQYRSHISL